MKPDILVFCETWLNDNIDDRYINIPGYCQPSRADRTNRRGGGVCVYFKYDVPCKVLNTTEVCPPWIESILSHFPSFNILLLAIYVPPSLSTSQLSSVIDYIVAIFDEASRNLQQCNIVILGDLNNLPTSQLEQALGLLQVVCAPTRGSAILDKILIEPALEDSYGIPIVGPNFEKTDHLSVFLKPHSQRVYSPNIVKVYDYRQSHMNDFLHRLKYQRWQEIYSCSAPVDAKCSMFYSKVNEALQSIPFTYVKMSLSEKPWMTPKLKYMINCRFEAFRCKQFAKYNHLKVKIKAEIKKAKSSWVNKMKQSPSGIWKATRNFSSKIQDCSKLLDVSSDAIPDAISSVFSSTFSPSSAFAFSLPVDYDSKPFNVNLSVEDTEIRLKKLKLGKSPGHDHLSPCVLKAAADILAPPLTHIYAQSISECVFPQCWKLAYVVPVPKTKSPTISDFRPISLLPLPSKILEHIVLASIKASLIDGYGTNQFGFRPRSSTLMAHISIHDFVTRQLDLPFIHGVALVAFDLKKAFDSLSHLCLLNTLSQHGLPSGFIRWVQSYLLNRTQRVVFNGSESSHLIYASSGVPQGSVLAPYLFALHMGSLSPKSSATKMIKYADDVTLLIPFRKDDSVVDLVESETRSIKTWCLENGLTLNDSKTKVLLFSRQKVDEELQSSIPACVASAKILGVVFSPRLSWNDHINAVTKAASRRIYLLKQLKRIDSVTKKDLIQIYQLYILSVLEYNSALFTGLTVDNKKTLEKLARRCHLIICGPHCHCSDFPVLSDRRSFQTLKVFKQLQNPQHILHHLLPHRLPRSQHFFIEHRRSELRARSFIPFCCTWSNSLS